MAFIYLARQFLPLLPPLLSLSAGLIKSMHMPMIYLTIISSTPRDHQDIVTLVDARCKDVSLFVRQDKCFSFIFDGKVPKNTPSPSKIFGVFFGTFPSNMNEKHLSCRTNRLTSLQREGNYVLMITWCRRDDSQIIGICLDYLSIEFLQGTTQAPLVSQALPTMHICDYSQMAK